MSKFSNVHRATYKDAYGIKCSSIPADVSRSGAYPTFCRIATGGSTEAHSHFECEIYYIISGAGQISIAEHASGFVAGDVIRVAPFQKHQLFNSGDEEILFLSVYSEDHEVEVLPSSTIITAAPPTPNGPIHLGHLSGPYLAADVMSRYLKLRGTNVQSITGTDDHQNYVAVGAEKRGESTDVFRSHMRGRILSGFERNGIQFDEIYEPRTDANYQKLVARYFERCVSAGVINRETLDLPHCGGCDHTLRDGLLSGKCPHCGDASSGACESCGLVFSAEKIIEPHCNLCGTAATPKPTAVYTFDVAKSLPDTKKRLANLKLPARILKMIETAGKINELKVIVAYDLNDSHAGTQEITVGSFNLHVWFEMAAKFHEFATSGKTWINCFGFDNSFYYLLFIPALQTALDSTARLPYAVMINEFLHLEGKKFSTSRNHAIWADEVQGNPDHVRFFLLLRRPDQSTDNFVAQEFKSFSQTLSEQFAKLHALAKNSYNHQRSDAERQSTIVNVNRFIRDLEFLMSPLNPDLRRAAHHVNAFVDLVSRREGHFALEDRVMIEALAVAIKPLMPSEAEELAKSLKLKPEALTWMNDWSRKL